MCPTGACVHGLMLRLSIVQPLPPSIALCRSSSMSLLLACVLLRRARWARVGMLTRKSASIAVAPARSIPLHTTWCCSRNACNANTHGAARGRRSATPGGWCTRNRTRADATGSARKKRHRAGEGVGKWALTQTMVAAGSSRNPLVPSRPGPCPSRRIPNGSAIRQLHFSLK